MKNSLLKIVSCAAFIICVANVNAQNTWLQRASLTADNGRFDATGFSIGHYGFIGNGQTALGFVNDFWKWNQRTNVWDSIAHYPGAGKYGNTSFTINGKGYTCLGYSGSANENDLWEYDTATNSWTQKASFPGLARYGAFVFVLGHKAYVGCGEPNGPPYYQDMWVYDAVANTWTARAAFPGGVRTSLAAFALKGYGYAGCGWDHSSPHNDLWKYDTTTDSWSSVASLPVTGGLTGSGSFVIDTLAFVGTGNNESSGKLSRDFWSYSATTNTWKSITTLTGVGRWEGVAFSIGDRGYIGTGYDSLNDFLQDYWEYTPAVLSGINSVAMQQGEVNVYPNPNNGSFTIALSGTTDKSTVEVYNTMGQQVYTGALALGNNTVELNSRANGVYLYRIISENSNLVGQGKLIIQK